jgi:predicted nucleotidyltransferase
VSAGDVGEVAKAVLEATPELAFAVLFGSRAKGLERDGSDVDVAIVPRIDWPLAEELALEARLAVALGRAVDVVRLDRAPSLLAWEIAKHGQFLAGDEAAWLLTVARIALEHADADPLIREAARSYARQVSEKGVSL